MYCNNQYNPRMSDTNDSDSMDRLDIYRRLANSWKCAAINREIKFGEAIFVPIEGDYAQVGGAIFLSVLCYPEDIKKQYSLVETFAAAIIKNSSKPRSPERKKLRKSPGFASLFDIPNKRIQQRMSECTKRLHKRNRAAWVLLQKMASNNNPNYQSPLRDIMLIAAKQNTHEYPAFGSSTDDEEQIINSFRQRVMSPSKPVAHLAMAFYDYFENLESKEINLLEIVMQARTWLPRVVEHGEHYRVIMGDIFPRYDTQYLQGRGQNFTVPLEETIAVLPFIDLIDPSTGWNQLLNLRISGKELNF